MESMGERLKRARINAGFTSRRDAASRFGIGYSTLAAHENGQNSISSEAAADYARAFGVTPGWLLYGNGDGVVPTSGSASKLTTAPLVGWVQAGAWQDPFDGEIDHGEPIPIQPHPKYPNATYMVLDVRGDSYDRVAPEGSRVIVIPWAETGLLTPLNGQTIVAEQWDSELENDHAEQSGNVQRTLKKVVITGDKVVLEPDSTNPRYKPLELDRMTRAFALVVGIFRHTEV